MAKQLVRAAVLGKPISHSLSPRLHNAAYVALGLAENWHYDRFEVDQAALSDFLHQVGAFGPNAPGPWTGFSLTMPLKQVALKMAGRVDQLAHAVGGANTLSWHDGVWLASNTDVCGITAALAEIDTNTSQSGFGGCRATILGAGATAASAVAALGQLQVGSIEIWARNLQRTGPVRQAAKRLGLPISIGHWVDQGQVPPKWLSNDLVISTLPPHGTDQLASSIGRENLDLAGKVLLDVAYADWPSALAQVWQAGRGSVTSGLSMLLHQAAAQVELMTGRAAPLAAMRAALME